MSLWTGAGLAPGTTLTNANVNAAGNGDPVTAFSSTGTFTAIIDPAGGVNITAATAGIARIDCAFTASAALRRQIWYKVGQTPTSTAEGIIVGRQGGLSAVTLIHTIFGTIELLDATGAGIAAAASKTPALIVGHEYQIDFIAGLSPTPSTTNGRIVYQVQDLTDPSSWNAGATFYYDSGYTLNAGTVALFDATRTGKTGTSVITTANRFRNIAWEPFTLNSSLNPTVTKAQFMAAPSSAPSTPYGDTYLDSYVASSIAATSYPLTASGVRTSSGSASLTIVGATAIVDASVNQTWTGTVWKTTSAPLAWNGASWG